MKNKLYIDAVNICKILQDNGFEAYFVGGCMRDYTMNLIPHDIDITTNALPADIQKLFPHHIDTGLKHGTVSVKIDDSEFYEVTTYRIDGNYEDGRHPDTVTFTSSIIEDLSRRDFTINAIAFDPINNIYKDPFSGIEDIALHTIACVGNAKTRFLEDPLRVLRAMRFAIKFKFNIDTETKNAMHDIEVLNKLSTCISKERITDEIRKMLVCGNSVHDVFMEFSDILAIIFPDMKDMINAPHNSPWHKHDIFEHSLCVVDACDTTKFIVKLAALFHDIGKPASRIHDEIHNCDHFYHHPIKSREICETAFVRDLRLSTVEKDTALELIEFHDMTINPDYKAIRRMIVNHGEEFVRDWIILKYADISDHIAPVDRIDQFNDTLNRFNQFKNNINSVIENMNAMQIKDLAISGNDIMAILNLSPGPIIGIILKQIFDAVINDEIQNDRSSLINYVESHFDKIQSID